MTDTMQDLINQHRVWYCLDCGKCGSVCPITRWETRQFSSPRLLVEMAVAGQVEEFRNNPLFWSCLTCKRCTERCPSDVHFSEFIAAARSQARQAGYTEPCTHHAVVQTWVRMMSVTAVSQNRLDWLSADLRVSDDSDTLYFVGCLPYYDVTFRKLGFEGLEIARAAIKVMNHLGIEPRLSSEEVCCGHDQLWSGDWETFFRLAERNLKTLKARRVRRVVTTCPECARTLKMDYPKFVGDHGLEVLHLAELLADCDLPALMDLDQATPGVRVTYQDPCRLGRHLGVYDAPRTVIDQLGFERTEMEQVRNASLCCGTTCWMSCGQVSKNIQVARLEEAVATGAAILVTACAKCQIHFKCAQDDPVRAADIAIEVRDLATVVAERLAG
jgi:heterodisulfide reductase subunit D